MCSSVDYVGGRIQTSDVARMRSTSWSTIRSRSVPGMNRGRSRCIATRNGSVASRKALRLAPGMMRAYQIIAVCSCSLRDQAGAAKAYERLDDKNKQLVRSLCEKNEVILAEP